MPASSSSSSSSSTSPQTPAVRTFQMDASSQGSLASSVNLFRGDVNLTRTLFTLPGRAQGSGLDVSVAIQYQSNVFRQATTWNADAPTGILGLGWDMPLTWIEAAPRSSPVAATRQYTFFDNGTPNQLFRQPLVPPLFATDVGLAVGLKDGATLSAAVLERLRAHGLAVASTAVVVGSGPWTVRDDALLQTFLLTVEGGALIVRDGGELYQLQSYQFWKIVYYPMYERWLVVTDTGLRRSFGGRAARTDRGCETSVGNSVAWSVAWADAGSRPVWSGPSVALDGQVQVARAWYLVELRDRFGSAVTYSYTGVEQKVGAGGKPFTKAVYLDAIKDSFGRAIRFNYGEKLWSAAATAPREYHDPHQDDPVPHQDRYETRYLASIEVNNAVGARMYSFKFEYAPRPGLAGPERAVANVTGSTGSAQGDTYKRLLTAVTQRDQDGVASPGLRFTYDLGVATPGGQPGALLSVTEPQGGVARYTYEKQDLELCARAITAKRPPDVAQGAAPRVFHGNDYVAVCFYNQSTLELSLQVYTWIGRWLVWSPTSAKIDTDGLTLATLRVHAQTDFLAVSFNRPNGDLALYVYQRDTARPGQWRPATIDGVATARDRPSVVYKARGLPVEVQGGHSFLVVSTMDSVANRGSHDVLTWRWTTQSWTRTTTAVPVYSWVTAGAEWFAVLGGDGRLQLAYLDGTLTWQQAAPVVIGGLQTSVRANVRLVAGAALVVVANLTGGDNSYNSYTLATAQWNADYAISVSKHGAFKDMFGPGNPALSWTPQVVSDTLVAVNGNLLRRLGASWTLNTALNKLAPGDTSQRFAYGPDTAVRVVVPSRTVGPPVVELVAYDPATGWSAPTSPSASLPMHALERDTWPSIADGDWLIVGPYAWFRGTSTWTKAVTRPVTVDLAAQTGGATFNSASLVNDAPGYVAFSGEKSGPVINAVTLRNGGLGRTATFPDERLYLAASGGVGGVGVSARGPELFVSFPGKAAKLDEAASVTLRRHAGSAVDGPITHYTVVRVEMDDGFGVTSPTSFAPDLGTAAADVSGDIVKFYANTVHPGAATAASAPFGTVVHRFLNGAADKIGDEFFGTLDGLLIRTETRGADGSLLEATGSIWTVKQQVASSPTDPAAPAVQLRGGWVAQTGQETLKDGVSAISTSEFVPPGLTLPVTGQPVRTIRANMSGSGVAETFCETTRHGVEFYPPLWAIHALADVAQVDTVRAAGDVQTIVASDVCTYRGWPGDAGEGVTTFASAAGFSLTGTSVATFPFATWTPGERPAGWTLAALVTARSRHGQETACVDAMGVAATSIFDRRCEMAVAQIANAAPSECAYLGFQVYEDTTGWTLVGVGYDNNDAYAGTRSAVLPAGGAASVAVTVTAGRADTWIVGCRYRTPNNFVPDASGLRATVDRGGGQTSVVTLPWANTGAAWTYVTLPVKVADAGAAVRVVATNTSASNVFVDIVLVAPLVNGATLRTFDPDSQQILATTDAGGRTSRTFYDRSYRPSVSVGASGLVRELSASFLSRRGSASDSFDAASPNAELTVHSAGGGVLESFRDGGRWAGRWQPAPNADWSARSGALVHAGAASGTLTWTAAPSTGTYAIYFELQTNDAAAAVRVSAGDVEVGFAGAAWTARQAGAAWPRLASPGTIANRWLLVVGDGVVCFFGDGQLLFSRNVRPVGNVIRVTVAGAVKLRNLTGARDIRLGVSYNDAGGRQRQVHQLRGDTSLICQLVFDALDRQIACTRSAPGNFGSGAAAPPLAYRPGFLDVPAFLAATAGTWEMTGDVADYYRGQTEGGVTRSDDQGYPYRGARHEASPRAVKLETSLPGRELAIDLAVPAAGRKTLQYAYGPNAAGPGSLPAGQYNRSSMTSPVKTVSSQVTDRLGHQVALTFADATGTVVNRSAGERAYLAPPTGPLASLVQRLPNAEVAGPQANGAAYVRTTVANGLQQTTSTSDVDAGTTRFIYSSGGDLRFVQPAMGAGEEWYVYYRYDAIGRRIEEGTIAGPWDAAALQQRADERLWPAASDPGVSVGVATEYDGNGKDPTLIGMKWRTTTTNAAPAALPAAGAVVVTEKLGYDAAGNLTSVAQTVAGAAPGLTSVSGTIGYAFNVLAEVVRVDLPKGCPVASIHYSHDDQGDVRTVGTSAGAGDLGVFGFNADRQPHTWDTAEWTRVIQYLSPGWVRSMVTRSKTNAQSFALELAYDADGALNRRVATFAFTGFARQYADTFAYDGQRRLTRATGASDLQLTSYDPNGNLWALARAGQPSTFTCAPGSDTVQSVSLDGAPATTLVWSARGQLTDGLGRSLEYVPASGLTRAVVTATAQLALAYGASQQRVVKQDLYTGRTNIYFCGAGQTPVAVRVDGVWAVMVHGPMGPLAWISDRTNHLLTDATRSVWGVVANGALRSATAWTPFGTASATFGDPAAVPFAYQAQEHDREVGLHNFVARLYDPALCRFLAPDPRRQFASPYVFAGNNPLMATDPNGELSTWAKVGIAAAMVAVAAAGVGLMLATGGASGAATVSAEATLAGTLTAQSAAATTTAGVAEGAALAGASGAAVAGGESSIIAGAVTSSQIVAGVTTAEAAGSAFAWSTYAANVVGSTLIGAGMNGLKYDLTHSRDFTARNFVEAVGIGAAGGLAAGAVGGALTPLAAGLTAGMSRGLGALANAGLEAAAGMFCGALNMDVKTLLTNAAQHQPWYQGLVQSTLKGAATGGASKAASSLGKSAWAARDPIATRAVARGIISDATASKIHTLPETAKAAALSDEAIAGSIVAGYFLAASYTIWGVSKM